MKIKILTIGKIKEKDLLEYEEELKKRVSIFSELSDQVLEKEEDILKSLGKDEKLYILHISGKELTSKEFSELLEYSKITFAIGPHNGFRDSFIKEATKRGVLISLSKLTFPHRLCKIILLEQIYRGFCIKNNLPYAK